jgi:hypothetical protein
MSPQRVIYLNQEKEVGVLACWSGANALLDVVLGNIYTLLKWVGVRIAPRQIVRAASPCCLEIVGTVFVVDSKGRLRLIMNCAVSKKCVSGLSSGLSLKL